MTQEFKKKRAPKGSVQIQKVEGWLRLVWTYRGQRKFFRLGLQDDVLGNKIAKIKAIQIENDIKTGNYDPTLARYKPETIEVNTVRIVDLIKQFREYKSKLVDPRTLEKYDALRGYCKTFFKEQKTGSVDHEKALRFKHYLGENAGERTVSDHITTIRSAWDWGIEKKLISGGNPWNEVKKYTKVSPSSKPFPFTKEEVKAIIEAFGHHQSFCVYADFVWWLFNTGCRTGEGVALKWKYFSNDCSEAWIGESYSRRKVVKSAKMYKARTISLKPQIAAKIRDMKANATSEIVFVSPKGKHIDDHNFSQRIWKPILNDLGIEYRKFYYTRSTFISHALKAGMHPVEVANYVGDSVDTIYKHYAAYIGGSNEPPILF